TPTDGCPRCLSGIFLGDLGEESQDRLLGTMRPGAVDVVKVAHHGSADQSPELYAALRPALGLIGVGAGNDYGHPTAKLLGILASNGVRPLRTDLDGMVLVAPGEREHEAVVWQQKPGGGEATLTGPQVASSAGRSSPRPPRPRVDRAARPGGLLHPGGLRAPPRRPLDSSHALSGAAVPIRADHRPAPIGPPMPGLSRRQFLA
ncbi:ComEC/Rec2 family competence protein, partial [Mesorhizobium japonicum]|uniref:ComEC/Rec2 family competence protein n=1 Tax=Mesorhizobium japonicum TaxID=2066070 RepID=UPI003B5AC1EC